MGSHRIYSYLPDTKAAFCRNDVHNGRATKPPGTSVYLHAAMVRHLHRDSVATRDSLVDNVRARQRNIRAGYLLPFRIVHRYCAGYGGERKNWLVVHWLHLLDAAV